MSYRNRDPRDYRSGSPEFESNRPDQYGQEHHGRRQYGQSPDQSRGWDQQQHGWQSGEQQRGGDWRGQQAGGWRGREPSDWRGRESREEYLGRESQDWQARASRDTQPLSQEPFGHEPFTHSAFGESEPPRYFGTGAQGYGGGPSFTGGTYGTADWRSDSPYFDEVGFNRGRYEDPLSRQSEGRSQYRQSGYGQSGYGVGRQQRRYPQGPKGYTRSDERLREDISERLMQAYDIDSSEVTVQVLSGKVVLEGTVPSRFMKHAIEDIADSAPGVQDVDNRVRVTSSGSRWGSSQDAGSVASNANNPVAGGSSNQSLGGTTSAGRTTTTGVRRDS
jgi:osmotically-inducible protein OsmY